MSQFLSHTWPCWCCAVCSSGVLDLQQHRYGVFTSCKSCSLGNQGFSIPMCLCVPLIFVPCLVGGPTMMGRISMGWEGCSIPTHYGFPEVGKTWKKLFVVIKLEVIQFAVCYEKKNETFWYVTEHVSDLTWGYLSYDMHLGIHSFNSINSYRLSYILIYNHIIYILSWCDCDHLQFITYKHYKCL